MRKVTIGGTRKREIINCLFDDTMNDTSLPGKDGNIYLVSNASEINRKGMWASRRVATQHA